jgi:hypothetical protein
MTLRPIKVVCDSCHAEFMPRVTVSGHKEHLDKVLTAEGWTVVTSAEHNAYGSQISYGTHVCPACSEDTLRRIDTRKLLGDAIYAGWKGGTSNQHPEISAMITYLYTLPRCSTGGPIHVVVDDRNIEDHWLDWSTYRDSLKYAGYGEGGPYDLPYSLEAIWLAEEILRRLLSISVPERKEVLRHVMR